MQTDGIVKIVAELKSMFIGLSHEEICDALGICVMSYAMGEGARACKGFFLRQFGVSCIMINSDLSERNRQIVLAHEMGHACLHEKQAETSEFLDINMFGNIGIYEHEANLFAAELLLGDEEVLDLLSDGAPIKAAAAALEVPEELMDYKFHILEKKGYPVRPVLYADSSFLKNLAG